jgi:hypothetical protein
MGGNTAVVVVTCVLIVSVSFVIVALAVLRRWRR